MNKIKQLEKQIIKEREELHKLDDMDWFIKAAHIHGLYMSIVLHSISRPNPNLNIPKSKTLRNCLKCKNNYIDCRDLLFCSHNGTLKYIGRKKEYKKVPKWCKKPKIQNPEKH